ADDRPGRGLMFAERPPTLYGPEFVHVARPTQVISGTVRDRLTGKPVVGVTVNGGVHNGWWENAVYATTDFQGRYRLVGLPKTAQRRITFFPTEVSPYLAAGFAVPDQEGLQAITLDAELTRGVVVSGRITNKVT